MARYILDNKLIGPYFLPPQLIGETYAIFLKNVLMPLLNEINLSLI